MSTNTFQGYLVIGDISGYTSYVASTELAHSQAVLTELLDLLVSRIRPMLTLVKLEGDAIFAHAPEAQIQRGESLLEMVESTYVAFRDRVEGIKRHTTCECNACRVIPTLDLKFMVHFGEYVIQHVSGINELVGSDVNLLHRLTKNQVSDSTGWQAYACFTRASLDQLGIQPTNMFEQIERYEHLGEVTTYNLDLRKRYKEISESRQIFVKEVEADAKIIMDFAVPQAVLWEWMTDPNKRNQYMSGVKWSAAVRSDGRTGVGSQNHCAHGKEAVSVETILDWKPFDYYTVESDGKLGEETMMDSIQTIRLEPIHDDLGTRLHFHFKLKNPNLMSRMMLKVFTKQMKKIYLEAAQIIQKETFPLEQMNLESALTGTPVV
jgi:carbon monoxide dehydrogenase subunit G